MFETLILQYLNKLVKSKVRDFASPKPFHTVKVQRLGDDGIKPFAQVGSNLVVPVFALVGDMPMQPRKLSDSTPIVVRPLNFARKTFAEYSELIQGVLQKLWRVFLFAGAKCQVGLHTEVYSYALTCSRTGFGCGSVCNNIEPIGANCIPKDLDIANLTRPLAVLVEREPTFVELQGLRGCVPGFERKSNTPCFKEIRRLELRRTIAIWTLELWKSTESVKEAFISDVDTDNHSVKRITGDPCPLLMRPLEQLRQVRLQAKTPRIFPVSPVISLFQRKEMVMDIRKVIKHIAETHVFWVFAQLELIRFAVLFLFFFFHRVSRITPLSPAKWEADTLPSGNASHVCQRDTSIKPQLVRNVKRFFKKTPWSYT